MRLGGFVIHGNNVETLGACLNSLKAVCDEVVAVDSNSTDGSAELARTHGARSVTLTWQGHGAARAAAVKALSPCDYVFYLDSDEYLLPLAIEALLRWKVSQPTAPVYVVQRRNWAELAGRRFVYRTDRRRSRLVRRDAAVWAPRMLVHESLPRGPRAVARGVFIEHQFARCVQGRVEKDDNYALLWAIQAHAEGLRVKPAWLQRTAHLVRDLLLGGALWRGGMAALRLAWGVSRYHAHKYTYLQQVRAGSYAQQVRLFQQGRLEDLFRR